MNILITGASRGIGKELVAHFAQTVTNATVYACSRNMDELQAHAVQLKSKCPSSKVIPLQIDLQNSEGLESFIKLQLNCPHLDILINNAGYLVNKPFEDLSYNDALAIVQVNFIGAAQLIRFCLPLLQNASQAHVVNISSMGGYQGSVKFPGLSYYSASKAAIASLTECLAEEYKHTQIAFNALALGAVQTEMLGEAFPGYQAPVKASEMASFIADFALSASRVFNGKVLPVSLTNPS